MAQKGVIFETGSEDDVVKIIEKTSDENYKIQIKWFNVTGMILCHIFALYGTYGIVSSANWRAALMVLISNILGSIGVLAGAHRLYSHRAYKAKLPLQIILVFLQTTIWQGTIYRWVLDHRVHHKYSETDADPHNSTRGLFFSHMGWLMCRKHPSVVAKGKKIDMSDVTSNPVLEFQRKYYFYLMPIVTIIMPTALTFYLCNVSFIDACFLWFTRIFFNLHMTWLINSWAHKWGNKPYDKSISPTESLVVTLATAGEGHHNFHHAFPWDYRQYEFTADYLNFSTAFIDLFAWLGWAYDLRVASPQTVEARARRIGDGSRTLQTEIINRGL